MASKIVSQNKLPRIACVGAEAITPTHGTGMMFARHFSKYPKSKIIDMHYQTYGQSYLFKKIPVKYHLLDYATWNAPWMKAINSCMSGKQGPTPGTSLIYQNRVFAPINVDWKKFGGTPDLIYSTCFSAQDFAFLHHVYRSLPVKVPIVQHFLDLDCRDYYNMVQLFRELMPAMVDVWALNAAIQHTVSKFSFIKPRLVQALHQPLSNNYKKVHQKFTKNFQAIIIGNIWSASAFRTLQRIWKECQVDIDNLPPVKWYGHPRRYDELKNMNVIVDQKDSAVRDGGLLTTRGLNRTLANADMAIVAFSGSPIDKEHYTKYSLPSRIGEYCANGLPLVVISHEGTQPWNLVENNNLGLVIDPAEGKAAVRKLRHFILDKAWRAECGHNARKYAEKTLNLESYQEVLYPRLANLAQNDIPREYLQQQFTR